MNDKLDQPPRPADLLFENLFRRGSVNDSFDLLADGIRSAVANSDRLLSDCRCLVESGRYASARFLLTTAREELAKAPILVDMCRVDLEKNESVLTRLCRAFYDHIAKHAYIEVLNFQDIRSMEAVREIWRIEVRKWWPAPPEDGEPDMPHDTYFDRESPLYVEYGNYDQRWLVPSDHEHGWHFQEMLGDTAITRIDKLVKPWREAVSEGVIEANILATLNRTFKRHYIGDSCTRTELSRHYKKWAEEVQTESALPADTALEAPIVEWPLYHCVANG